MLLFLILLTIQFQASQSMITLVSSMFDLEFDMIYCNSVHGHQVRLLHCHIKLFTMAVIKHPLVNFNLREFTDDRCMKEAE